jgi:tripartite-type tricarboxylate transporter receptor subunit TctC
VFSNRVHVLLALVLTLVWPAALSAQSYPNKPVRIIVPFGAGAPPMCLRACWRSI